MLGIVVLILVLGIFSLATTKKAEDRFCPAVVYGQYKNPESGEIKSFGGCDKPPVNWVKVDQDITANWKTHDDKASGFQIQYPPDLEALQNIQTDSVRFYGTNKYNPALTVNVYLAEKVYTGTPEEMLLAVAKDELGAGFIKVHKYVGKEIVVESDDIWNIHSFLYDQRLNAVARIDGRNIDDSNDDFYNKIISTFKFTQLQVDMSSWKTYTNSKSGFELKYPSSWFLRESEYGVTIGSASVEPKLEGDPGNEINVVTLSSLGNYPDLKSWFDKNDADALSSKSVKVGGNEAIEAVDVGESSYTSTYLILNNKQIVRISIDEHSFYKDIYNTILSTFRLLK